MGKATAKRACPHAETCVLFPFLHLTLEVWRNRYCDGDNYDRCARYQSSLRGENVPMLLLPNGDELAVPGTGNEDA